MRIVGSLGSIQSVHSLSHVQLFVTPWTAACQASLYFTISLSLLKLMSIESVMPSNHLILCQPLLLLPSIFPSDRIFSSESALCIRWPKYWRLASASVLPMNIQGWFPVGLTGLILQSRRLSRVFSNITLRKHQFFSAQFSLWSNSHMTTGKTIALTIHAFVGKVMSLLFNMLFTLVTAFRPRSKRLFHGYSHCPQWIWNSRKKMSVTASTFPPSICHEVMGPDTMILAFLMLKF